MEIKNSLKFTNSDNMAAGLNKDRVKSEEASPSTDDGISRKALHLIQIQIFKSST